VSPAYPKPSTKRRTLGEQSRAQVSSIRPMVELRDDYRCVVSMTEWGKTNPCTSGLTMQHRVGRGAGGSALFDGPAYLIAMCQHHNTLETSSADFAAVCLDNGWKLPRNRVDVVAATVPVRYWDGWYLLESGSCLRWRISDTEAARLMAAAGA